MGIEISNENLHDFKIESLAQKVVDEYLSKESEWIDEVFNKHWPKYICAYTRFVNRRMQKQQNIGFILRTTNLIFARLSGLTIHRNKHLNITSGNKKGFRNNRTVLERVTTTVLKHGKEIAKKEFQLITN
jgi:hypothetical protein